MTTITLDHVLQNLAAEKAEIDALQAHIASLAVGSISPELQSQIDAVFNGINTNRAAVQAVMAALPVVPTAPTPAPSV